MYAGVCRAQAPFLKDSGKVCSPVFLCQRCARLQTYRVHSASSSLTACAGRYLGKPLLVVVNDALMGNHQMELAVSTCARAATQAVHKKATNRAVAIASLKSRQRATEQNYHCARAGVCVSSSQGQLAADGHVHCTGCSVRLRRQAGRQAL